MDSINPEVMLTQVKYLGDLLRNDFKTIDQNAGDCFTQDELKRVRRVYAIGDGDSWHVALAAEMAFQEFAGVEYIPLSAMKFLEYGLDYIPMDFPETNLVIGISASGGSIRVVQSMEKMFSTKSRVLAASLIGNPDSKLGSLSKRMIHAKIPKFGPSPGILTYMASMLGLVSLAICMGEANGRLSASEAESKRQAILDLAGVIEKTIESSMDVAKDAAHAVKDAAFLSFVGSGPGFGTACFSAAKVVEAAGVFSAAQDLEEWAHVEGLAYPIDFPVYLIGQPGKGYWRAEKLANYQQFLGHRLMIVGNAGDAALKEHANYFFPIEGTVSEEFSPLVSFVPSCIFACFLALELERTPFMTNDAESSQRSQFVTNQIKQGKG